MTEPKEIIIDLANNKYEFTINELIHQNEFSAIKELIDNQLSEDEKLSSSENDWQNNKRVVFPNINRTIMLNGIRGTGKTTFLQALVRDLPSTKRSEQNSERNFCETLEILDYLDPTLIEEKSSIFLTIISLIRNRVYDKLNKCCNQESFLNKRKFWQASLDKFARGLPAIDENTKVKSADYWDDANQIMEKGLEDVSAAFSLRKNFSTFLKESLEILEKKSFLLVIDDVDTDSGKAWVLLETLRKYLSVNRIITIVSGDIQLFSTVVRNKQECRFVKTDKNNSLIENQIEELSNQYLKKVLPVRYRILLPRLQQLINKDISLKVQTDKDKVFFFKDFIKTIFSSLGILNNFQREGYTDFLLNLPLRTQIDWMRLFKDYVDNQNYGNKEPFEPERFVSLFIDELIQNGIDVNLLVYNPNFINSIIIDFLMRKDILSESYQLQATCKDNSINAVLYSLSMLLSRYIHDKPSLIFDNLIKIGYLRNIKAFFRTDDNKYSFKSLTNHIGVTNDKDVRQMVCLATAYLRGMLKHKDISGIIKLSNAKFLLYKKEIGVEDYIARLPYSNSMVDDGVHEYSLFTLLGSVNDLIRELESGDSLLKVLQRLSQPREYSSSSYSSKDNINSKNIITWGPYETNSLDDDETVINDSDFETTEKELNKWLEITKKETSFIPSHVLAKVATRLYYTFNNIDVSEEKSLGDIINLYIIAFFNSVIIEETMELTADSNSQFKYMKITNKNVRSKTKVFITNLNAIIPLLKTHSLPLSRIILTCPIFLFFINFESNELLERYKNIIENINFYKSKGCYSKLKNISPDGTVIGKEHFSVRNINNILEIIKTSFTYDIFMKAESEDLENKIFGLFEVSKMNYKRSLDGMRKLISEKNIKW